ncbi:hypothetical protein EI555_010794, partial [Monodon monoceros]
MYVTSLFQVLPQQVSIEAIQERLEAPEDKSFGSSLMETEVNLDSYQTALEEVLSWLLSAEDTLQAQGEISNDVEEVKEQFHTHEGYMMDLTSHQGRVGNVLQLGSQLIGTGKLSEDEETEVQEQMNLLNSRWECLRVASMEKQSKLDVDITELHSWITRSEAVLQSPEFAIYRKEGNFSDLKEKVNAIEREKAEKFRKLQDASRSAQALVEQMLN